MPSFSFLHRAKNTLETGGRSFVAPSPAPIELALYKPCPNCRKQTEEALLWEQEGVCSCGHHFRLSAMQRCSFLLDEGTFESADDHLESSDPLDFPGYEKKLKNSQHLSSKEAVLTGRGKLGGEDCFFFFMDPFFMMGSMGTVVGEKITRIFELATKLGLPVVGFTVSGGARMQEGMLSLMQMAKTSAAIERHHKAGLFYLTVLTDPTTGGVMASFAMEGDIILAEPEATVGFAGARVIEQTTRKKLPHGFQTAEFLLDHGFVDAIVPRSEQKSVIAMLLKLHKREGASHESHSL